MRNSRLILLILCFLFSQNSWGQGNWYQTKNQVKQLCMASNYRYALDLLEANQSSVNSDEEGLFLQGLCLYQLNKLDKAQTILESIISSRNAPIAEVLFYLGKIYHSSHKFEEAVDYYKSYLKMVDAKHPNRKLILDAIKRCSNGLKYQFKANVAFVENLGMEINSSGDDFAPVPSPNYNNVLYFSSTRVGNNGGARNKYGQTDELFGNYSADIFSCRNSAGQWRFPQRMHYLVNSNLHDVIIDFSANGKKMYYYQGASLNGGRIMVDTFQQSEQRRMSTIPFLGPVDATADYTLPHFVSETFVVFSSRNMGGYGGMDLFVSYFQNGNWSVPKNLGPNVNTAYDEVTPYLVNGGKELFYSSNDPRKSIGGFDILRATYNTGLKKWLPAINLGIPVNSAGDDAYFRVANDGYSAFFSSNRKDGLGQRDIYIAYFNEELLESNTKSVSVVDFNPTNSSPNFTATPPNQQAVAVATPNRKPSFEFPRGSTFELPSAYFNETQVMIKEEENKLQNISSLLKRYPQLKLVINVYSAKGETTSSRLIFGMQQAQAVSQYYQNQGVNKENIVLRTFDGSKMDKLATDNYAVELDIIEKDETPLKFKYEPLDQQQLEPYKVIFKILYEETDLLIKDTFFDKQEGQMLEKTGDTYRYYVGRYYNYEAIQYLRKKVQRKKTGDLPIIPFVKGKSISKEEIREYVGEFPILRKVLE